MSSNCKQLKSAVTCSEQQVLLSPGDLALRSWCLKVILLQADYPAFASFIPIALVKLHVSIDGTLAKGVTAWSAVVTETAAFTLALLSSQVGKARHVRARVIPGTLNLLHSANDGLLVKGPELATDTAALTWTI